ncbi:23S rRNA pseudouridine1911/1915/1917 synthase [Clostridium collagenovorans DSM 3089]|uniref:Pseudouridine synthase n=1 Tax=Clostridium collagenovorans DSM 3089 TaxID=1121306 RepID=A0A1M5XRR6_9CLOT|nr:RluA family pseudouridine synthase [Clostridium collagenovorans]SHI02362.1 23S rRNA pseudouridine1911/1915/1917 synthase [Clostridium collagenovorans DSM 3089]
MENNLLYRVKEQYDNLKLRDYLKHYENLSSRMIKSAGIQKRIKVNGKVEKLNYIVKLGDEISFNITKEESQNIMPEPMELDIVFEDMDLIVVNKSPNMVVHPTKSHPYGTLANGLMYHFKETNQNCIVRLVSRLDMDTSGLIMIGKNQHAHMVLSRDMQENKVVKEYLAIIHGNLENKSGTIDLPIGRRTEDSIKREVLEEGQRSITHYEVLESYPKGDLVRLRLETGRTHQIRVHLSHLGHPIFGDVLYGEEEKELIDRQALHAYRLEILHPKTREKLELQCDLPEDMKNLIENYLK